MFRSRSKSQKCAPSESAEHNKCKPCEVAGLACIIPGSMSPFSVLPSVLHLPPPRAVNPPQISGERPEPPHPRRETIEEKFSGLHRLAEVAAALPPIVPIVP